MMPDKKKMLVVKDLIKRFGRSVAVNNVSFEIYAGEFFAVIGPSGCGKTTTLRCIAGLEKQDSGAIYLDGKDVAGSPVYKRGLSMVFQDAALFPHMNVFNNIAYGLRMMNLPKDEIDREVRKYMKILRLEGMEDADVSGLSAGQMQRVALARSLVLKPSILLFDEPIGALDLKLRQRMLVEFKSLHQQLGFTALYVTHDQEQAMTLADRIIVMNEGQIEQVGTPIEVYSNPATVFVAKFVGTINLFRGKVTSLNKKLANVKTAVGEFNAPVRGGIQQGMTVGYAVRPEKVLVEESSRDCTNTIKGKLTSRIYKCAETEFTIQLSNNEFFKALMQGAVAADKKLGDEISLGWFTEDVIVTTKPSVIEGLDIDRVILGE